jgi:hypothetical protein
LVLVALEGLVQLALEQQVGKLHSAHTARHLAVAAAVELVLHQVAVAGN